MHPRKEPGTFKGMQWSPVVHHVYRTLNESLSGFDSKEELWLVMFSGGVDSVSLLEILLLLQSSLGIRLAVFHLHHGPASEVQESYRNQALQFSQELAQSRNLPFYAVKSENPLSSENDMRKFRQKEIQNLRSSISVDRVIFGHHQDDLLETQIMRMIRGAGPEAGLSPMKVVSGAELRPLLRVHRTELKKLAEESGWKWLEDPSNQDSHFLRNWIRNQWLPMLEDRHPGALNSFSRSFDLLSEALRDSNIESLPSDIWVGDQISRPLFLTLTNLQKSQCLALYLRKLGAREFNHNQIKEILKHLDISQVEHIFVAAHMTWTLSQEFIVAKPALRMTGLV